MQHDDIDALRRTPAWRLLRSDNAPLALSFLGTVFVEQNVRSIGEAELVSLLDDALYAIDGPVPARVQPRPVTEGDEPATGSDVVGQEGADAEGQAAAGARRYPRSPKAYLDHWSAPEQGWLRKFYPTGSEEAHYDATPAVEKAVSWVSALRERSFVGTESRLNTVFELLRQLTVGTESDADARLRELEARRARIDEEIERVRAGQLSLLDAAAQRDRYQQLTGTAADLLADFREVEANFRTLDREMRERITGWDGAKGDLLDAVVGSRSAIADSDQGRSFHAFYDFLLDRQRQEEFAELVEKVQALPALEEQVGDDGEASPGVTGRAAGRRLRRIHYDWLDAGERTQSTVRVLSEQLRRFLDDQVWLENRRVIDVLRSIESRALALRDTPDRLRLGADETGPLATTMDATSVDVHLPTERPLYRPQHQEPLASEGVTAGVADFDASALFTQVHVDPERLSRTVRDALRRRGQVSLAQLVEENPLEQGLAELVTYLSLDDPRFAVVHDPAHIDEVRWVVDVADDPVPGGLGGAPVGEGETTEATAAEAVPAVDEDGFPVRPAGPRVRVARVPRVTFARTGAKDLAGAVARSLAQAPPAAPDQQSAPPSPPSDQPSPQEGTP
ncbi:DUF3375 domain-containing protein [Oerskovia paurometabola]|uniref:DUF3375 domain-containing protein n=1 Tax=Oerskovia paurometabola TaxID=162170 RepID=A0ABW1XAT6_9CELL|nr:DUF3375 domain-containing protein [Oerskovia paurometabola]MBM7496115.1 hypothetical protein [Oerskovia paurometabola]